MLYTRSRRGFTLIELLVVIAIISILATILFPVFSTAREKARQTTCSSNLRQLGLAFAQYSNDNDEMYPGEYEDVLSTFRWEPAIYPYVKSKDVYTCPDDLSSFQPHISYGYNSNNSFNLIAFAVAKSKNLGSFTSPAKTVMLYEASYGNTADPSDPNTGPIQLWGDCDYGAQFTYATGPMGDCLFATLPSRHPNGATFLAADGHVKFLRPEKVSGGKDSNGGSDVMATGSSICLGDSHSAQNTVNRCAEGTEHAGADSHTLTFSTD